MASAPYEPIQPIRQEAVGRIPAGRGPFTPKGRRKMPRWVRALLISILLQLLLLALLAGWDESKKPTSLAGSYLAGARQVPGPVCVDEAVDVSGSMVQYTAQRNRAERALAEFSRRELKADDVFAETAFAKSARTVVHPVAIGKLTDPPGVPAGLDPDDTRLAPAVRDLIKNRTQSPCAARSLVIITDGQISDPSEVVTALRSGYYTRVCAVIPWASGWESRWGSPNPLESQVPGVAVYRFTDGGATGHLASMLVDAKPLDIVYGDIVASLTGQQLKQIKQ